jgi:transposase
MKLILRSKKGRKKLKSGSKSCTSIFRESASTIENHLRVICNYFFARTTSGVMEGINNRIKLIMRQGMVFLILIILGIAY